jgi:U3 small nucleolar ribonucleoprotein component
MSDYLERAEESRERNESLHYEEFHERRAESMTTQTENETRANRATLALDRMGDDYSSDREEAAVDLMTDLLHMIDKWYGIEPESALRSAWHHFMAEREA